jgi:hypothetical protein
MQQIEAQRAAVISFVSTHGQQAIDRPVASRTLSTTGAVLLTVTLALIVALFASRMRTSRVPGSNGTTSAKPPLPGAESDDGMIANEWLASGMSSPSINSRT